MKLSIKPSGPLRRDPKLLTIFGQTKVGKTTMLSKLPEGKYLVIDTEQGTDFLTINRVQVHNLQDLKAVLVELKTNIKEYPFEFIIIDTLDVIVDWAESFVLQKEGVAKMSDIAYGGGYSQVRTMVMNVIDEFAKLDRNLILVGHRKKTSPSETDTKEEFSISTLDISGKLKNFICADSDAIGYVYRGEDSELMISFKPSDFLEAGARCDHLKGQIFPFKWENIYVDVYGTPAGKPEPSAKVKATVTT